MFPACRLLHEEHKAFSRMGIEETYVFIVAKIV